MTAHMSKNATLNTYSKKPNEQMNEDGVPLELRHQLAEIANVLQYLINSTSWRNEEKYYGFDALEIDRKLKNCEIGNWINSLEGGKE